MSANPALSELLNPFEVNLMQIARRQFVVEAFVAELNRVSRGKRFRIRNGVMWMLMLDTRDMLVVHLASWAKGVYQPGGLIGQLQGHHVRALPRALPVDKGRSDEPEWVRQHDRKRRDREHAEAFTRLFPTAGAYPDAPAFEMLRDAFCSSMEKVIDDRNWNRAHAFEKVTGTTAMLNVAELRAVIGYAEQFLGDLAMVGCHYMLHRPELNHPSGEDVAPELVEGLLLGDSRRAARLRGQLDRDAFYEQLHTRHDAGHALGPDAYFNDA